MFLSLNPLPEITMFQTDLIHFLQSFESKGLTLFMQFITQLGYPLFFMILLIAIIFGIHFKKGIIMILVLFWTGSVTYIFKESFALPRPYHVDNTVQKLDKGLPDGLTINFEKRDAPSFFAELPKDVVAHYRQQKDIEYGFPSGHTSIALAFWIILAWLFRKKWLTILSGMLIVFIPFSRMYLGVHFLADVLGGIVVGLMMIGLFYGVLLRPSQLTAFLHQKSYTFQFSWAFFLLVVCPILLTFALPSRVYLIPANLLGFGLGYWLIGIKGFPTDKATWQQKGMRTFLAFGVIFLVTFLLKKLAISLQLDGMPIADFIRYTLSALVLILVGIGLSARLRLYDSKSIGYI